MCVCRDICSSSWVVFGEYICVCAEIYVRVRGLFFVCIYVCVHRNIYIYTYVTMNVYTYVCIYTNMYSCIVVILNAIEKYVYIFRSFWPSSWSHIYFDFILDTEKFRNFGLQIKTNV